MDEESVVSSTTAGDAIYKSLLIMYSDQRRSSNQPPLHLPPQLSRHHKEICFAVV